MNFNITGIPAFTDNYIWAMHNESECVIVDPGDANPVITFLERNKLKLTTILVTHHHWDHTDGLEELKQRFPEVTIYGPNNPKIQELDHYLHNEDTLKLDAFDLTFNIIETPGHTLDHIAYVHKNFVLCGDTLFSGGCGRMFEGTPKQFLTSLQKLASLPPTTKIYCTHEYTQANLKFAQSIEPQNKALIKYASEVDNLRQQQTSTLPTSVEKEIEINPFLRCHKESVQQGINKALQLPAATSPCNEVDVFAQLRRLKDTF